jgi:hypothetical protein
MRPAVCIQIRVLFVNWIFGYNDIRYCLQRREKNIFVVVSGEWCEVPSLPVSTEKGREILRQLWNPIDPRLPELWV